jgi:hypothetical protein
LARFRLDKAAGEFADELSTLLNRTVCTGIRLKAVITRPERVVIGHKIDKHDLDSTVGIPITLGAKPPTGYLSLSFRLTADVDRRYLMVESSFMGLFVDAQLEEPVLHYDYERDKGDGYPEAHLQVCASSEPWDALCAATRGDERPLARLHLPVGGRRFRPTLEDLIDFLLAEQIADAHTTAVSAVEEGRERFRKLQLRAAVRRDPETALAVLRDHSLLP